MARGRKKRNGAKSAATARPKRQRIARRNRHQNTQLAFEAISIEGGLLSPDWLARIAGLEAGDQSEAEYRIPKGLNLRDEIGRYWRISQALWAEFRAGCDIHESDEERLLDLAERFVRGLLCECFGFRTLTTVTPLEIDERIYPIGFAALDGRVPVVITALKRDSETKRSVLDEPVERFGDGIRRRSPFGLCQEFLNIEDRALWGVVSDGDSIRILRDNASLTRPAWIAVDLNRIFTEERYADFAAFWLLAHETRFGSPEHPVTDCALERWRSSGLEEGTRAREQLRDGVEQALLALGQGFLAHPENNALRTALAGGTLTKEAYFQELLRLAYRLIFALTVEERGVLHPDDVPESTRKLYAEGYSLRKLRERSVRRSTHDRHHDHWEGLKIVFRGLSLGEPRLGLPALAGIFAKDQCKTLDEAKLENRYLMLALFRLSWLRESTGLARVNWRDMGPEELGSVYESLLELVPQITDGGRAFSFATGAETKGHARKTTGSYYTPDSLVQVLLDSALEPVVKRTIAEHPDNPVEALLNLSVVDPACGSGHFLLAAARRLASHVARIQANGTPSVSEYRHALRQVVGRCIYGVDLNLMAVELCKVSLWMEAVEPGLPLTFLDAHIRHGNALLGTTPELMEKGIPDDAWKPIEGDDKKVASALKKRNKLAEKGQRVFDLWSRSKTNETDELRNAIDALESASDADMEALAQKESKWQSLLDSEAYQHQKFVADAWCAAFVWPKQSGPLADCAPTNELWRQIRDGQGHPPELTVKTVNELADQYTFFHWHLAFPQVFAKGGFDVVLGNPPWERVKLQEQEFFATRSEVVSSAKNSAIRKRAIEQLQVHDPALWQSWKLASRLAAGTKAFLRLSGRYPLCGKGDVNTYSLFSELNSVSMCPFGRAGFIVPTNLATDDTTKDFFANLVEQQRIAAFLSFENEGFVFPSVHHAFKFALMTLDGTGKCSTGTYVFFARHVRHLDDDDRRFELSADDFVALNPMTRTCPTFRSKHDADLTKSIHHRLPTFRATGDDPRCWNVVLRRMIHMSDDADCFRISPDFSDDGWTLLGNVYEKGIERYVPLCEAKIVHHFDHRFSTYEGQTEAQSNQGKCPELDDEEHLDSCKIFLPRYWISESEVDTRLGADWKPSWMLGWRDVCRSVDQRTLIASIIPRTAIAGFHQIRIYADASLCAAVYANLCSFILDYVARQKVGGTHLTYGILEQLPMPTEAVFSSVAPWGDDSVCQWLLPRILELTYTAWDLEPFAHDVGYDGPPFRWNPERRFLLRAELDAAFFHLYKIEHDDVNYIMETFPIVKRKDEVKYGEGNYCTKDKILEIYDAMQRAIDTGEAYITVLNPPPADPQMAHQESTRPDWAKFSEETPPLIFPIPETMPIVEPQHEVPLVIWAFIRASGGSIQRIKLARSFALWSQPDVLCRLASDRLVEAAGAWRGRVGQRVVAQGTLAAALRDLADRNGVLLTVNETSQSVVSATEHTPEESRLDPWFVFEARLALNVLSALPASQVNDVDAVIAGSDRIFLTEETG